MTITRIDDITRPRRGPASSRGRRKLGLSLGSALLGGVGLFAHSANGSHAAVLLPAPLVPAVSSTASGRAGERTVTVRNQQASNGESGKGVLQPAPASDHGLGLTVHSRMSSDTNRLGRSERAGLIVTAVAAASAAAHAGFQEGDVILEIDGEQVASLADLQSGLQAALNRPALILVLRGDSTLFLTLPSF